MLDCCCGSVSPVNVVGAPGVAGSAGASGALVLLGSANVVFNGPNGTSAQPVPINALNYIIKDIVITLSNNNALSGAIGGLYETSLAGTPLGLFNFNGGFAVGDWASMTLQSAALTGQLLLTYPVLYFILSQVASTPSSANAWVYVYGYLIA